MNDDILIGVVLLAVAIGLIFIGRPSKAGVSPRFFQFDDIVYIPAFVLVFLAAGD